MIDTAVISTDTDYEVKGETVAIDNKSFSISPWYGALRNWNTSAVIDNMSGLILRTIQKNKRMLDDNDLKTSFYQYATVFYNTRKFLEISQADTNSLEIRSAILKASPDIGNIEIEINPIVSLEGKFLGHKKLTISALKKAQFDGSPIYIE